MLAVKKEKTAAQGYIFRRDEKAKSMMGIYDQYDGEVNDFFKANR